MSSPSQKVNAVAPPMSTTSSDRQGRRKSSQTVPRAYSYAEFYRKKRELAIHRINEEKELQHQGFHAREMPNFKRVHRVNESLNASRKIKSPTIPHTPPTLHRSQILRLARENHMLRLKLKRIRGSEYYSEIQTKINTNEKDDPAENVDCPFKRDSSVNFSQ